MKNFKLIKNLKLKIKNWPKVVLLVAIILGIGLFLFSKLTKQAGAVPWPSHFSEWGKRKQITLVNNSGQTLNQNTTYQINLDTSNQKEFLQSCDDLRVVYQPSSTTATELPRNVVNCNSQSSIIYFPLQSSITNSQSSADYYVYYSNPHALTPNLSPLTAYDTTPGGASFVAPFNGSTRAVASGSGTPSVESGAVRFSGGKSALAFDGGNDSMALTSAVSNVKTFEFWVNSIGNSPLIDFGGATATISAGAISTSGLTSPTVYVNGVATTTISSNVWSHVAITTSTAFNGSAAGKIGLVSGSYFNGKMDEIRFSDSVRYSAAFTPQTSPFVRDANTKLLLHFDENGDDPRNSGKAIDDSGNGNHGTITGAKYVDGLVGVSSEQGIVKSQSYAGHQGVFIEEGTTNKITNPSFENSTYDTNWAASGGTASQNTTAPYYKFGSNSYKLVLSDATDRTILTSINAGNTNTHTLSAYLYRGTSGSVGSTIGASQAQLVFNGSAQTTTYTDMGGGWWRLTYSAAAGSGSQNYGVQINEDSGTYYLDGVQLEEKAYATTYADGTLGTGYAWTGTANNSTSTRTDTSLWYPIANNVTSASGAVSFWIKDSNNSSLVTGGNLIYLYEGSGNWLVLGMHPGTHPNRLGINGNPRTGSSIQYDYTRNAGSWNHVVLIYVQGSTPTLYVNGTNPACAYSCNSTFSPSFANGTIRLSTSGGKTFSDLRIFDRALSSGQVAQLYYAGLGSHSEAVAVKRFSQPEDPIAYWKLDEGQGQTLNDSSTSRLDATLGTSSAAEASDPAWQTEDMCVAGKCLYFEGSNASASATPIQSGQAATISAIQTLSFWAKPASSSGTIPLMSLFNGTGEIGVTSSNLTLSAPGITSPTYYVNGKTGTTLTANQWNHVEVVTSTSFNATNPVLGKIQTTYFKGFLDEVKFYNYARTAAQVKADYDGAVKRGASLTANPSPLNALNQGLVGYWKMNEASWNGTSGEVLDASGNGNNGTSVNGATTATGKFGNGGSFDGSNDYVGVADKDAFSITTTGEMTVSTWLYATANLYEGWKYPVSKGGAGGYEWQLNYRTSNGYPQISFSVVSNDASYERGATEQTISNNTWVFIVAKATRDGQVCISKNGGSFSCTTYDIARLGNGSRTLNFGARNGLEMFKGSLDEVRIYNRALSAAEVRQLYNFAPGPVAHWKFDDGSGTSVTDSSGNANTGTWYGSGNHWTTGKFGKAGGFNGTDDYVNVSTVSNLVPSNNSRCAWINTPSLSTYRQVVDTGNSGDTLGVYLMVNNQQKVIAGGNNGSGWNGLVSNRSVADSTWHHVCAVFTSGNHASIYIDGNLDNFGTVTYSVGNFNTFIGKNHASSIQFFRGFIDDVKIYNYARTPDQILEDMNGRAGSGISLQGVTASGKGSLIDLKMDEGSGTTTKDSSGNGKNGTLNDGAAWSQNGKYGRGIQLDGSNDDVSVADFSY